MNFADEASKENTGTIFGGGSSNGGFITPHPTREKAAAAKQSQPPQHSSHLHGARGASGDVKRASHVVNKAASGATTGRKKRAPLSDARSVVNANVGREEGGGGGGEAAASAASTPAARSLAKQFGAAAAVAPAAPPSTSAAEWKPRALGDEADSDGTDGQRAAGGDGDDGAEDGLRDEAARHPRRGRSASRTNRRPSQAGTAVAPWQSPASLASGVRAGASHHPNSLFSVHVDDEFDVPLDEWGNVEEVEVVPRAPPSSAYEPMLMFSEQDMGVSASQTARILGGGDGEAGEEERAEVGVPARPWSPPSPRQLDVPLSPLSRIAMDGGHVVGDNDVCGGDDDDYLPEMPFAIPEVVHDAPFAATNDDDDDGAGEAAVVMEEEERECSRVDRLARFT